MLMLFMIVDTFILLQIYISVQIYNYKCFCVLQINSIVDVGVSFYSQSQKIQGQENANVHVSADEPSQKPVSI